MTIIADAPSGCFEGNTDPDPDRQAVRRSMPPRASGRKIAVLGTVTPPRTTVAPATDLAHRPVVLPRVCSSDPDELPDARHLDRRLVIRRGVYGEMLRDASG